MTHTVVDDECKTDDANRLIAIRINTAFDSETYGYTIEDKAITVRVAGKEMDDLMDCPEAPPVQPPNPNPPDPPPLP